MTRRRSRRQRATSPGMPAPSNVGCAVGARRSRSSRATRSSATGASSATMVSLSSPTSCASPPTAPEPDRRARSRPEARPGPRRPARRPRPAAGRRSRARHSAACADRAPAGGPAPPPSVDRPTWPAAMLMAQDGRATVTMAHPSTAVHPFAGQPLARRGCAEGRHAAQSRGSSSDMLRLQRLAGG